MTKHDDEGFSYLSQEITDEILEAEGIIAAWERDGGLTYRELALKLQRVLCRATPKPTP